MTKTNGNAEIVRERVSGKTALSLGLPSTTKDATHMWVCYCEKTICSIKSTWHTPWLTYCYCDDCRATCEWIDNYKQGHSGLPTNFSNDGNISLMNYVGHVEIVKGKENIKSFITRPKEKADA